MDPDHGKNTQTSTRRAKIEQLSLSNFKGMSMEACREFEHSPLRQVIGAWLVCFGLAAVGLTLATLRHNGETLAPLSGAGHPAVLVSALPPIHSSLPEL